MVKETSLGYDELASVLAYDAELGTFTWRLTVGTKAKAGSLAGSWATIHGRKYLSITYRGRKMMASQVAWALYYKEWPDRTVLFIDEDSTNVRISNLKKADYVSTWAIGDDGSKKRKMSKEQARHYGLARNYNMTLTQYAKMFSEQNGRCAICDREETARIPGRKTAKSDIGIRDLCVDHDHETGAVRQLLCNACNHMLGHAGDEARRLRAAADYIEFHRKAQKHAC